MSALPFRFRKFLEGIRPTVGEGRALRRAHLHVRRILQQSRELRPHFVATFLQGSYRRATAIRALDGKAGSDVDLVLVTNLDPERYPPEDALGLLRPLLRQHGLDGRMQGRSLKLVREGVSLDLVLTSAPSQVDLALLSAESSAEPLEEDDGPTPGERQAWKMEPLWIPDREAKRWRRTHPLAQLATTRLRNHNTDGHFINVVKVLKAWAQDAPGAPPQPKGYALERLIEVCCPDGIESVAEGMTLTLEELSRRYRSGDKPRLPGHGVRGQDVLARVTPSEFAAFMRCVSVAAPLARRALDEPDDGASAALWAQLLGPRFPVSPVPTSAPAAARPIGIDERLAQLGERRRILLAGLDDLLEFKRALRRAVELMDLRIVWDPSTPPELRDYLGVAALDAAKGALIGGGVGLALGAFTRSPRDLMWAGALVGAVIGGVRGAERVRRGWRIRCWYDALGEPCAELVPLP